MEEKVIIKNEKFNLRKIFLQGVLLAITLCSVPFAILCVMNEGIVGIISFGGGQFFWLGIFMPFILIIVLSILLYFGLKNTLIIVTNRRVYGKTFFGANVDLPLDSISAVGTKCPKLISVSTSSGKISFVCKNFKEIHTIIRELLIKRQEKTIIQRNSSYILKNSNSLDDLVKLKNLMDNGIITQEEFETKKKEILGI